MIDDAKKLRDLIMKRANMASRLKAYKLGMRWGLIKSDEKKLLGDLLKEVLAHTKKKYVLQAFCEGESHAQKEKNFLLKNLQNEIGRGKETKQDEINKEVAELQKIREVKQQEKDQSKSR